jgi:peptide/nickel transport system permease protein
MMFRLRRVSLAIALGIYLCALLASVIAPMSYEQQYREALSQAPGGAYLLGTDDLGRDRFSRLLYGTRTSLLLAPAAAFLATAVATILGIISGALGGVFQRRTFYVVDLMTGVPTVFLLLTLRALLPLNVSPGLSLLATFSLLGLTGWASGVRVISTAAGRFSTSGFAVQARAYGCTRSRLLFRQVLPNVWPIVLAQFWIAVPLFILAEANLSMLGLGVSDPLPSLGNLMTELQNYAVVPEQPWILAPAVVLVIITAAMQMLLPGQKESAQ